MTACRGEEENPRQHCDAGRFQADRNSGGRNTLSPTALLSILNALLTAGLIAAVTVDVRSRRVPNAITLPVALLGLVVNAGGAGWPGFGDSLGGLFLGMVLLMPVWLAGGTGAGDVKLLGMVGALRGVQFVLWTGLFGAVAGGLLALIALACRGGGMQVLRNVGAHVYRITVLQIPGEIQPTASSFRMSYALAIALGALAAALHL